MPASRSAVPERQLCYTLAEIANELGCTGEYVRQLQASALRKCWFYCWWEGYRIEDLLPSVRYNEDLDLT